MTGAKLPRIGAEVEMPLMAEDGRSACAGPGYFARLAEACPDGTRLSQGGVCVGVAHGGGVNGIDNGFNLLETAHAPVDPAEDGLTELETRMQRDLAMVARALAPDGLYLCTLAQHPTAGISAESYAARVAPKTIYRYLSAHRGWDHAVGIDAKAQNGPTTEVRADHAIAALNLLLTAAPAFIALFANSPFEGGRESGLMETRMTLWPRMVAHSRVAADRERCGLPPRLFDGFGDYWLWTFAPGTVMQAVPLGIGSYKGDGALCVAGNGALCAAQFFDHPQVGAQDLTGAEVTLHPAAAHFEYLQWSNFLDFRLRFAFAAEPPSRAEIAMAFARPDRFEGMFHTQLGNLYLENRCAGASFTDRDLIAQAGRDIASGAIIGPSAVQAGLVMTAGSAEAKAFIARWPMETVRMLRAHAIRAGLGHPAGEAGQGLQRLCTEVLELASHALPKGQRSALRYPQFVLETGLNGASRALSAARDFPNLDALARSRMVVIQAPASGGEDQR